MSVYTFHLTIAGLILTFIRYRSYQRPFFNLRERISLFCYTGHTCFAIVPQYDVVTFPILFLSPIISMLALARCWPVPVGFTIALLPNICHIYFVSYCFGILLDDTQESFGNQNIIDKQNIYGFFLLLGKDLQKFCKAPHSFNLHYINILKSKLMNFLNKECLTFKELKSIPSFHKICTSLDLCDAALFVLPYTKILELWVSSDCSNIIMSYICDFKETFLFYEIKHCQLNPKILFAYALQLVHQAIPELSSLLYGVSYEFNNRCIPFSSRFRNGLAFFARTLYQKLVNH